ncbi:MULTISPECIES: N4-gp56 family major capsid protein [Lactiplantibacillus]|uniref:N4-gp56 family major capsid protein n=1 Tax=Lactiplantibacillus TaxID=2767842 RepID=UPI0007B55C4C|nr:MULTISPECIES: N4-gp56 family major capsid protein [Lactiplantibacillus]KZU71679.1 Phage major capsid protein [Lactiplantibacillus plantarum]MCC6120583.1 N4-gp56 family major capsid protein [Lactiplantibacillus plantarum]MCT3240324.1 N4-gp56 family major capsid protein [Lactiplantibacillus plantarum]MCT4444179.1 N4-gp56 family major capsid protein [Lactiplantibacillus argentoratensis]MCW6137066.1 N4-gp56 family major capsid protein [Lactiplantibacillus plantarum]
MADETTVLDNLIDPQVMTAMISAKLPKAIRFSAIAPVDTTLEGRPGTDVTVPRYKYIGDATDVDEGGAIDYASLSTDTDMFTIKKAGKGVKITDEAALSGYGDPVGEGQRQITMAIASKIDNDILATAMKARLTLSTGVDVTSLDMVDAIEAAFNDDTSEYAVEDDSPTTGVLFMNPKDVNKLRKAAAENWTRATDLGDNILINGTFGELLGWQIVRSRKIKEGSALAVKPGAMRTYMKRDVLSEKGRDMDHKITKFNADEHYGVAIYDDTKLLVINPFDVEGGTVINQNVTSTKDATVKKSNKGKAVAPDTPSK